MSLSPGFVLAPSLLSADFAELAGAIRAVEEGEAGALHLDVMDGHFVPNITFGPALVKAVRARTRLPLDIHLMVTDPLRYIRDFAQAGGDTLAFHLESSSDPHQVLERIRAEGKRPGIALRPKTPLSAMEP
ncbi:ribulose-phosphate 3-epimerase, partial [mine drainage metagenome]